MPESAGYNGSEDPDAKFIEAQDHLVEKLIGECRVISAALPLAKFGEITPEEGESCQMVRQISHFTNWEEHQNSKEMSQPDLEYLESQYRAMEALIETARKIFIY